MSQLLHLEEKIGYSFKDKSLLQTALTHSSYANESATGAVSYERLEFLGDSVLGFTVAEYLYSNYPQMPEGRMTRLRSELVCEKSLFGVAKELQLGEHIRFSHGMENNGGRERVSILADVVEAIIAAMTIDSGLEEAKSFIYRKLLEPFGKNEPLYYTDAKTALQELVQQKSGQAISYELLEETGPDHDKQFRVAVLLNSKPVGEGSGHSKKEAEQMAAGHALDKLLHDTEK